MNSMIKPLGELFRFNTGFYMDALKDITEKGVHNKVTANSNPMIWIAGHITLSRYTVIKLCGESRKSPYEELFIRGSSYQMARKYPSVNELKNEWINTSEIMNTGLMNMDENDLLKDAPFDFPVSENRIINGIAFMFMHESYHIGQLGFIRKALGYKWEI